MIGTNLSHFKITAKLGEGGMGEVYRADDTKLGREVAIKVLPTALTEDSERLARFEREAKVLATLNHPHIGAIYGLEQDDGRRFLVLELVEGDTLAERLFKGPMPVAEICKAKVFTSKALEFCASEAMQIFGGAGYLRGNPVERIYREVKVMAIGGGSEEIMRDLAVRQMGL